MPDKRHCSETALWFEQRVGIARSTAEFVDSIMEVRRCAFRIAGVADSADDMARMNPLAALHISILFQVRIVMKVSARADNPDTVTSKAIVAHRRNNPLGRAADFRSPLAENIYPFVTPAPAPGSAPRINEARILYSLDGNGEFCRGWTKKQGKSVWNNAKTGDGQDREPCEDTAADADDENFSNDAVPQHGQS